MIFNLSNSLRMALQRELSPINIYRASVYAFKKLDRLNKDRENLFVLAFDADAAPQYIFLSAFGGKDYVNVDFASIFRRLLMDNCLYFAIAHNHLGVNIVPSEADWNTLSNFSTLSDLFGMYIIDSIVFSEFNSHFYSMRLQTSINARSKKSLNILYK